MTANETMTKKATVLILDDSVSYRVATSEALKQAGFGIAAATDSPELALETIRTAKPDIVIFDLILTRFDGIEFFKDAISVSDRLKTGFIAVSSFASDVVVREVMRLGAVYYLVKPINLSVLTERVKMICSAREDRFIYSEAEHLTEPKRQLVSDDMEGQVTETILELGIPAHVMGYRYVRSAILLSLQSADAMNAVTKIVYPTIAKQYRTSSSRVERAIRHSIEIAWDRGNVDKLNAFFGYSVSKTRGKPTNAEFIATIADRLRLRNKCTIPSEEEQNNEDKDNQ